MPYFKFLPAIHSEYGIADYPAVPVGVSFLAGRVISEPLSQPLVFPVSNPAEEPPRHLIGSMIPVASKQLIDVLQAAGVDNIQTFPAILRNDTAGLSWSEFFALNVIGLVDAVDTHASRLDMIMEGGGQPALVDFQEVVLAEAKVANCLLFRTVHSPGDMFISDRVRDELIRRRPPEGWGISTIEVPVR